MEIFNQTPGSKYTESGKFDLVRLLICSVIGYFVVGALGVGYGLLTDINPIIYLNLLILVVAVFLLVFIIKMFTGLAKLRNRYIAMCLGLVYGIIFTYNAWSAIYASYGQSVFGGLFFQNSFSDLTNAITMRNLSIGKLGRNGAGLGEEITSLIYIIEFLILACAPVYMLVKDPNYYCEECDKEMESEEKYFQLTPENTASIQSDLEVGKLKSLFELEPLIEKQLRPEKSYIELNFHTCPACSKLVYSAAIGTGKMNKEDGSFKKNEKLQSNLFGIR